VNINQELPGLRTFPPERMDAARQQLERVVSRRRRVWAWGWKPSIVAAIALSLSVGGGLAIAANLTKGPIPSGPNGELELNHAPNFISVSSGGRVVGYAPRAYLIGNSSGPVDSELGTIAPVYGPNLTTLVGHLYPGIGFVPLGSAPTAGACTPIIIYNGSQTRNMPCPTTTAVIPNVIGEYTPTVAAALSNINIYVRVVYAHSESVPKGDVISLSPSVGSTISARSVAVITSSLGPKLGKG
jgi:hypothetical protein